MEASGGADPRRREREGLPLLNGAPLFGAAAQTLAHHRHPNHAGEEPESSSNPDPVSFAFAASSGPPAMTSPGVSAGSKPKPAVRYRECLRNHAASVGGSVFDGCGEFMPAGEEGSLEALKCAACDCHRNFHRKESDGEGSHHFAGPYRRSGPLAALQLPAPPALPSPSMVHHPGHSHHARHFSSLSIVPPMSVAYGGGGAAAAAAAAAGTESSSEDLNLFGTPTPTPGSGGCYFGSSNNSSVKKRSRTKFTQEQKEKMMEFAEKIGWKMQRQSDEEVERFCADVGVKRQVFKVWMHNNKNNKSSSSSKPLDQFQPPSP